MRKRFLHDTAYIFAGSVLYASGIYCFLTSADIAPGGVSGISIMLNYLFGFPVGISSLLINIPVFITGYILLDRSTILRSIPALLLTSVIIDSMSALSIPVYTGERLIAGIFGGVTLGAGVGIIFSGGCTTGGTDIVSLLLKRKFPHLRIGIAMLITDCIILTVSVFVFGNAESGLYGIITLFCSSKMIDYIVYSGDISTLTFIVSDKYKEISADILKNLDRGVTIIEAEGGYTGKKIKILMCAVRRREFPILKELILSRDRNAFISAAASDGIFGEGFSTKHSHL